eukprot:TRINITY_DN7085_c0_g1_i1.p1 TRINITY_DN7085_c0_g1~~TRINITY_DN7085_c0_g1_i1.p1  ORF type:complete len:372 (-),score=63.11 TRINITY_DN7085_c0_g1_i1:282-1397(-)
MAEQTRRVLQRHCISPRRVVGWLLREAKRNPMQELARRRTSSCFLLVAACVCILLRLPASPADSSSRSGPGDSLADRTAVAGHTSSAAFAAPILELSETAEAQLRRKRPLLPSSHPQPGTLTPVLRHEQTRGQPRRGHTTRQAWLSALQASGLWSLSGLTESFSSVFLSELGDKSFFLTMTLAVSMGKSLSLLCSLAALWLMTGISTSLGAVLSHIPTTLGGQSVATLSAGVLMIAFGVQALWHPVEHAEECKDEDPEDCRVSESLEEQAGDEIKRVRERTSSSIRRFVRYASLIFLAEWGDRSMLATVALAAARSPMGVFVGGCAGHTGACLLAVLCGAFLKQYLSERVIKRVSGCLFLFFGLATVVEVF